MSKTASPRVKIIGIVNVTPDSFADGGSFFAFEAALAQADRLIAEGADILDIGGESTRPGSDPVPLAEELRRVIPLITAIRKKSAIPISIDTYKAETARQALAAGANIINDISALRYDSEMTRLVVESGAPVILMHMQGDPKTMQEHPVYEDVVREVGDFFREKVAALTAFGVSKDKIILDPGIGFGKTLSHNLSLLKHLDAFTGLGCRLLLAHSRKRFFGGLTGITEPAERDLPTAVVAALAVAKGISMVRVHNVAATRQALIVTEAIEAAR
ncbi:MAG TPA: dihydropteroate synthase [Desulfobulbaceae bacterium]|nr:dihydropteroate synthase [Desulfobulbaceae bacterium]